MKASVDAEHLLSTSAWLDWRWAALFAAAGAMALGLQVYLLREFMVTLSGDEAALGLGLGGWLGGIALGAMLGRSLGRSHARPLAAAALTALGVAGVGGMVLARFGRSLVGVPNGELMPLGPSLLLAAVVFGLPGAMVGAGFVALAASAADTNPHARDAIGPL